jgi:hypothetical protein
MAAVVLWLLPAAEVRGRLPFSSRTRAQPKKNTFAI